jgi:4-amino-4-deoxy-L-arabinose transferase-like glycosyltransferase
MKQSITKASRHTQQSDASPWDATRNGWLISLGLFLLALLPRLPDLGRFLTADEFLWIDRSRNFLAGLTNPAYQCDSVVEQWQFVAQGLACTLRTGHPGVTTMWTGSFGFFLRWLEDGRPGSLHDYVVAVSTNPLDASFIAPERLATVLLTSLWVVAVYWLARRLFGAPIALIGAILIALNPFHIAHSRVIQHDALSTTFMTLSVLGVFIYWGQKAGRKWLLFSGMLAGLAFISKIASLYLMPFIALTGLWFFIQSWTNGEFKRTGQPDSLIPNLLILILDGLLWFAAAMVIIFIVWPAMWIAPMETVETVFDLGFKYTTGGHAKGNFLLGQVSQDPGALFYPVTWLYRVSPLVLVGVIAGLIAWPLSWRRSKPVNGEPLPENVNISVSGKTLNDPLLSTIYYPLRFASIFRYLPLILIFILGYGLMLTIGEKKQERYFLPAYPWFDFIAAAGLFWILDFALPAIGGIFTSHVLRFTQHATRLIAILVILILILNGYLVAANFPYYFTYYNPLLGGIQGAAKAVTIGWGEGLDLAAAYLNQNTDPTRTRVASWYESTFAPFYQGDSISYSKEKGKALAGDYVIFYINQTQRRFPDEAMFDYFETRFEPKKVISLHGLDYAWIYPSLGVDHYLEDETYTGIASLLAWQWTAGDMPLLPGQPADFELYWEYLGKRSDEPFFFRVIDAQERVVAEAQSQLVPGESPPPEQWAEGEIIAEAGTLTLPPGTPPGQYRLQIGFYTHAPAVTEGELLFALPKQDRFVTVGSTPSSTYTLPATATPIGQPVGDSLTLLGASWPDSPLTNHQYPEGTMSPTTIPLDLYWRIEKEISANFAVHLGLMDEAGAAWQAWFDLSLAETFEPAKITWKPGDIIHTSWRLSLLPEAPAGDYHFDLVLPTPTMGKNQNLSFGRLVISPAEMSNN